MDNEDIATNPLFLLLQTHKKCQTVYANAGVEKYIILVPSVLSLSVKNVCSNTALSHVLVPQASDGDVGDTDVFSTYNGKQVLRGANGTFVTGTGFKEQRTVKVLFEETHYDDEFESFTVICIASPLLGKLKTGFNLNALAQNESSIELAVTATLARSLREHRQYVKHALGVAEAAKQVFKSQSFQFFTQEFGFTVEKNLAKSQTESAQLIRDKAFEVYYEVKTPELDNEASKVEFTAAMECHIHHSVHDKIFDFCCTLTAAKEKKLQRLLRKNKNPSLSDMQVEHKLTPSDLVTAIATMGKMNKVTTPLERLVCLSQVNKLLGDAVFAAMSRQRTRHQSTVESTGYEIPNYVAVDRTFEMTTYDKQVTKNRASIATEAEAKLEDAKSTGNSWDMGVSTDDILPFFVYVLLKCQLKYVYANIMYMTNFKPTFVSPETEVVITHLRAAAEYIEGDTLALKQGLKYSYQGSQNLEYLLSPRDTSLTGGSLFDTEADNVSIFDGESLPPAADLSKLVKQNSIFGKTMFNNNTFEVQSKKSEYYASLFSGEDGQDEDQSTRKKLPHRKHASDTSPSKLKTDALLSDLVDEEAATLVQSLTATEKLSSLVKKRHSNIFETPLSAVEGKAVLALLDSDSGSDFDEIVEDVRTRTYQPSLRQQRSRKASIKVNTVQLALDPLGLMAANHAAAAISEE